MGLAHIIQNAWNKQAGWLVMLRPFSLLYGMVFKYNKNRYTSGKKKPFYAPVPVMVIGNITVGGSGKTPLLITLVRYLQQHNVRVGVISRGYGGVGPFPCFVTPQVSAKKSGDEPALIVQNTRVPMAVGANRKDTIEYLLKHAKVDLIISDDGLQHWALGRQIEWIVLDSQRGLGNQQLLPEGFLREPVERLKQGTVIEHHKNATSALNMHLETGQPYLLNGFKKVFNSQQKFHVIVGIGYPERFYQTLNQIGIKNIFKHEFQDHHTYVQRDIEFSDHLPIITTEKDAIKLKDLDTSKVDIWVLPVEAILSDDCYNELKRQLRLVNINI